MASKSDNDLDFPVGRWLLWGLAGMAALTLVILGIIWLTGDDVEAGGDPGPQVEWSIVLADQTGDTVTLKGDMPSGRTTETWRNDIQLIRSPGGTFEWDMDAELPVAVVDIDAIEDCAGLNAELTRWVSEVGTAPGEPEQWQARAFAQHTIETMRSAECEIDEAMLQAVTE